MSPPVALRLPTGPARHRVRRRRRAGRCGSSPRPPPAAAPAGGPRRVPCGWAGGRNPTGRAPRARSTQRSPASCLGGVGDQPGPPVDHGAAVVDGVLEHRPGEHQAVGEGHGDAHVGSGGVQALAGDRTVQVQGVRVNPYTVGTTIGQPPMITPRWATSPASSTAYSHARSARPRRRSLRCRVRSVADSGSLPPAGLLVAPGAPAPLIASRVLVTGQSWRVSTNNGICRTVLAWAAASWG